MSSFDLYKTKVLCNDDLLLSVSFCATPADREINIYVAGIIDSLQQHGELIVHVDDFNDKLAHQICRNLSVNEDFRSKLWAEGYISLNEFTLPKINVQTPYDKSQITRLVDKFDKLKAKGHKRLNTDNYHRLKSGLDEFSNLKLEKLKSLVTPSILSEILSYRVHEKALPLILRWVLRGLPIDMAIAKTECALEASERFWKSRW